MSKRKPDSEVAREIEQYAADAFDFVAEHSAKAEVSRPIATSRNDPTPEHIRKHTRKKHAADNPSWFKAGEKQIKAIPGGVPPGPKPMERQESIAQMVALYTAMGISQAAIAQRFSMSAPTLKRLYLPELCHGKEINEMFWIGSLANAARKGKVDAIKFALERKFGWIEKSQVTINDGESGIIFSGDRPPARDITDAAFEEVGPANAAPVRNPDDEESV